MAAVEHSSRRGDSTDRRHISSTSLSRLSETSPSEARPLGKQRTERAQQPGSATPSPGISCGYLPLLEQCSLTLSVYYFVTQSCPCYTPIDSDLATLHPARPLRHRSSPEQAAAPGSSDPIVPCAQVGVRSKQVMNSPLNQCYVTCMLVSRPIEDTTRYRG